MSEEYFSEYIEIQKRGIDPAFHSGEQFYYYTLPDYDEGKCFSVTLGADIGSNKFLVKSGAILISKLNPRIKRVWLVSNDEKFRSISSTEFVVVEPKENADAVFLYYLFQSDIVYSRLESEAVGTTNSHVRYKPDCLYKIKAKYPPPIQRYGIAKILKTIDQAIEKTEALIEKYQHIKAGLMHDLFTRGIGADGKLRQPREQAPELYQQTPIGWIPKEWGVRGLKELYKRPIRDFGSFSSTNLITFLDEGVPFIKSEMIKEEDVDWSSVSFISTSVHGLLSKSHVQSGQILFSKIGSALGKAVLYDGERGECNSNAAVAKIEVDRSIVNPQFIEIFLNSIFARKQFQLMIISLLPRINLGDINKLLIQIPKIDEQNLICARYNTLKVKLKSERNLLAKLRKKKSGLMHDLLTGEKQVTVSQAEAACV